MHNFSSNQPHVSFLLDSDSAGHGVASGLHARGGSYVTTSVPKTRQAGSYVTTRAPKESRPGSYVTTNAKASAPAGRYTASELHV